MTPFRKNKKAKKTPKPAEADDATEEDPEEEDPEETEEPPEPKEPEDYVDEIVAHIDSFDIQTQEMDEAKHWVQGLREPLVAMGVEHAREMMSWRTDGEADEAKLRELYAELSPDELNAVISANADSLGDLASDAEREAALWTLARQRLTSAAASHIMAALLVL